jgi:hypothetical protein
LRIRQFEDDLLGFHLRVVNVQVGALVQQVLREVDRSRFPVLPTSTVKTEQKARSSDGNEPRVARVLFESETEHGYFLVCQRAEQALDDLVSKSALLVVVDQDHLNRKMG